MVSEGFSPSTFTFPTGRPPMYVKESVKLHSAEQLEIKQEIGIDPKLSKSRYRVESYFFFPAALNITPETCSNADFRRPLKNYVRIRLPRPPLEVFQSGGRERVRLAALLADPQASPEERSAALKRYALLLKGSLKRAVSRLLSQKGAERREGVVRLVDELRRTLDGTLPVLAAAARDPNPQVAMTAAAADEYLAVVMEYHAKRLVSGSTPELRLFLEEAVRRREREHPESVASRRPEDMLYRWRSLKKFISSQLFLTVRMRRGNPWLQQSIYGFAAAVSMIFATVVAFLWQERYGALSLNLFLALVVAYIFKDRLKDWMRQSLSKLLRRWLPSRRQIICANDGRRVGLCRESFDFVPRAETPPEILALRTKAHYVPFAQEDTETIFLHRKEVELQNARIHSYENDSSLYDITRIGILPWTANIDLQFEELPFADEDDERAHRRVEKLYHVYLVRRIQVENPKREHCEVTRLVLKHHGLKAVERVLAEDR